MKHEADHRIEFEAKKRFGIVRVKSARDGILL